MRVGLLTQWYDPEPGPAALPGVLARGLRDRGHEVQVLTGFPNYPTGSVAEGYRITRRVDERLGDIDVRRVALYPNHDSSALRRLANYASFGASATLSGLGALREVDALWVNYSPITVAWPMWAAGLWMRVPSVVHVLDLWPDTLLASGFSAGGRLGVRGLHAWCRGMYAAATSVAYISPGIGAVLRDRGVPPAKLHYVPMWANEDVFHPTDRDMRPELSLSDEQIVLLYAGALGTAQGLSSLVEACAQIEDPRFVCLIAGSGVSESSLRALAIDKNAVNVRFLGRVRPGDMTRLMAAADISYVGLSTNPLSAITMPSKTQAALAAGRALLVAAEGDVARVVEDAEVGLTVHPGDARGIAHAITRACALGRSELHNVGERARKYYEATFSVKEGVGRVEALLEQAAGSRRGK